jgi:predicted phage terminase large subunit-like protein
MLLKYQQMWNRDSSPIKICEKSRRIGISWADAADSALVAAEINGSDSWYVGYNFDMSRQYIEDVAYWARAYNLACSDINESVIEEPDKNILAYTIRFDSGFKVTALSSRPANLRSKKGRLRIDEAAFHDDLEELIKAALAINMWGGKVAIWSTHNGKDNHFNSLIEKCKTGELNYSYHRYDLDTAIADGLYRRICLVSNQQWTIKRERAWIEQLRKDYGINAREELDCIPFEAKGAGCVFKREWFEVVDRVPTGGRIVRFWDLAASTKSSAFFTAGVKMKKVDGVYYVLDAIAEQVSPAEGKKLLQDTGKLDGKNVFVNWELEGGSSGGWVDDELRGMLRGVGLQAAGVRPLGDKVKRASPFATQALNGNVKILRGDWNERYLDALYKFEAKPKPLISDLTDASSGAYHAISKEILAGDFD